MDEDIPVVKPKVYTEDPFSYNYVALKKSKVSDIPVPSVDQLVSVPLYNELGHLLGIDNVHDWAKYYDKVFTIAEWAKERSGYTDTSDVKKWIADNILGQPSLGAKNIENIYNQIQIGLREGKSNE